MVLSFQKPVLFLDLNLGPLHGSLVANEIIINIFDSIEVWIMARPCPCLLDTQKKKILKSPCTSLDNLY